MALRRGKERRQEQGDLNPDNSPPRPRRTALQQIRRLTHRLQLNLRLPELRWPLWYHRGSARAYFIIPQAQHRTVLKELITGFLSSPWNNHFELTG